MFLERSRTLGLFCILVSALSWTAAQGQNTDDPFATPARKAVADDSRRVNPIAERIRFEVEVSPKTVRRGETFRLTIQGKLNPGFHTYPLTERSADSAQDGQTSELSYGAVDGLKPLWPIDETPPRWQRVEGIGSFLEHDGPFRWSQDVLVLPDASPGAKKLPLTVTVLVCDRTCVRGTEHLTAEVDVSTAPPVAITPALQKRLIDPRPALKIVAVPSEILSSPHGLSAGSDPPKGLVPIESPAPAPAARVEATEPVPDQGVKPRAAMTTGGILLASVGAAIAMLLTPCVFPMIPITVSFFLKQSERRNHNALLTAAVYSLTIIGVLAIAVLVLGQLIVQLANDAWVNLALGALLVFFALSLFGMYEIELPAGLARFTSSREGSGGYIGAVFMALTFTITSFTCTGPFLGPLLVAVKEYRMTFGERVAAAFCYSGTFAAPFFVMALFPSLLKKLPRSGAWLNAVKVVMGFLELGAAAKFLANTDLAWNPGDPALFNYETVLCLWIALSIACGLYLLGVYRLPHDTPLDHIGVLRMLLAAGFLGLALYITPALWRITPQGAVGRAVVAFLPLDTRATESAAGPAKNELTWHRDYAKAWDIARREDKLIFIDFTGQACTNCRYNEKNVFPKPDIWQELKQYVLVQLYTDYIPDPSLTAAASQEQARRNSGLQSATFQDVSNPLYAVVRPAKDEPFEIGSDGQLRIKGKVLGVRTGMISPDLVPDFEHFLSGALTKAPVGLSARSPELVQVGAAR